MGAPTENILVRGVNWLGDAVMSIPALIRLREAHPAARISILTHEKLAGLWHGQRMLDEVLTFFPGESPFQIARRLKAKQFTAALAFPNSIRSAAELSFAGIPRRIGVKRPGSFFLLTETVPPRPRSVKMRKRTVGEIQKRIQSGGERTVFSSTAHHVHHYLHLVAALGASSEPMAPRIDVSEGEAEGVRNKFSLKRDSARAWFGLNPGAEYGPAKRWPPEGFVEAARLLQKETRCRWVIFGGQGDLALAESIAKEIGAGSAEAPVNLAGKTSLRELACALKICDFVLTNDTGPMHLAAAVGAPMVAVFGSTSPELTGPIFSPQAQIARGNAPCAPCFLPVCPIDMRCLRGIGPEEVVRAALAAISTPPVSPR